MKVFAVASALVLAGCVSLPPAPPQRADTAVNASFGKTWDAVVDYFARSSIPVKTIDRSSGLIAAEATRLSGDNSSYATCSNGFLKRSPEGASFNALVRGDSTRSTVRVTATWMVATAPGTKAVQCVTTDAWERNFESAIKTKAETP
jgi:hypothetical protein